MPRSSLIVYENKDTRYSVRAVVAAAERRAEIRESTRVRIVESLEELMVESCAMVEKSSIVIVGTSLLTTMLPSMLGKLRSVFTALRKCGGSGRLVIVTGGPHPTGDPYGTLFRLGADVAVIGEAEKTIEQILELALESRNRNDVLEKMLDVPGLAVKIDGEAYFTGRPMPVNLDDYPPFPYWRRLFAPIEITRGCPWACRYCETWFIHGARPRHRSIEVIVFYSEKVLQQGLRDLRFISPNSLGYGEIVPRKPRPELLEELLDSLTRLTARYGGRVFFGSFPSEVRPDYVTDETVKPLVGRVANKRIIIGAQSGSDRLLKLIHRGHTVDDVINAVEVLERHGFETDIDFIFGLPYETSEDVEETLKLIARLVKHRVRIHLHTFLPLPGTPFEDKGPGKIQPKVKRRLYKLIGEGKAYGYWEKQEKLAEEIAELRRKGIIVGLKGYRLMRRSR